MITASKKPLKDTIFLLQNIGNRDLSEAVVHHSETTKNMLNVDFVVPNGTVGLDGNIHKKEMHTGSITLSLSYATQ